MKGLVDTIDPFMLNILLFQRGFNKPYMQFPINCIAKYYRNNSVLQLGYAITNILI